MAVMAGGTVKHACCVHTPVTLPTHMCTLSMGTLPNLHSFWCECQLQSPLAEGLQAWPLHVCLNLSI